MPRNYFSSGQWNFYCDVCGRKLKSGEGRKRWDGYMVCSDDYETRHPQDFLRTKPDRQSVPWSRPKNPDQFVVMNYAYSLPADGSDTPNITDQIVTSTVYVRSLADSATMSDNAIQVFQTSDSATMADTLATTISYYRTLTDSLTAADYLTKDSGQQKAINGAPINIFTIG